VIYVRKEGEKAHGRPVECNTTAPIRTYLIVDDFIASGNTLRSIRSAINLQAKKNTETPPKCVGILLYDSQATRTFAFDKRTRVKVYIA
jgi:hypoxanthine-guanine phosphoribosyltransferase